MKNYKFKIKVTGEIEVKVRSSLTREEVKKAVEDNINGNLRVTSGLLDAECVKRHPDFWLTDIEFATKLDKEVK
jgi:hypothetical protein